MNLLQQNKHLEDSRFGKLSAKQTLIRFSHSKSSYTQKEKVFNIKKVLFKSFLSGCYSDLYDIDTLTTE